MRASAFERMIVISDSTTVNICCIQSKQTCVFPYSHKNKKFRLLKSIEYISLHKLYGSWFDDSCKLITRIFHVKLHINKARNQPAIFLPVALIDREK